MNKNPLLDDEFLKELYRHREKEIFAKIIALTLTNDPIEEIQGQVTGGSVSLDGASSVRRTCNLTLVAKDLNINQYYWGLKNRFRLYIGLKNIIGWDYEDIIWFPMGTYVISNFSTSQSVTSYTVSITGKDKMTLLNGELSGSLFSSVDFGKEEYYADGVTTISYIPIKNIIREAVHAYADESWENIIINDLEDYGIELLEYAIEDKPMYLFFQQGGNETAICEDGTDRGEQLVYPISTTETGQLIYDETTGTYDIETKETGEEISVALENIDIAGYNYDSRIDLNLSGISQSIPTKFCRGIENEDRKEAYTIAKIVAGQTCGYRLTDITYPGDLILNVGEPITAMLDKLVTMLGNFEYFYDIDGRFVFQRKPTFVDKTWNNIKTGNQNSYVTTADETYVEAAAYTSPVTWTFGDSFLITSYANTPALSNVRNDFSIWGTRKSVTGSALPVHLRYAVDKKPTYYKTFDGIEWTTEVGDWWVKKGEGIVDVTQEELENLVRDETREKIRKRIKTNVESFMPTHPTVEGLQGPVRNEDGSWEAGWWDIRDWHKYYMGLTGIEPRGTMKWYSHNTIEGCQKAKDALKNLHEQGYSIDSSYYTWNRILNDDDLYIWLIIIDKNRKRININHGAGDPNTNGSNRTYYESYLNGEKLGNKTNQDATKYTIKFNGETIGTTYQSEYLDPNEQTWKNKKVFIYPYCGCSDYHTFLSFLIEDMGIQPRYDKNKKQIVWNDNDDNGNGKVVYFYAPNFPAMADEATFEEYIEEEIERQLTPDELQKAIEEKGYRHIVRKKENLCDWREIIFQMALDYRKHNHDDDFYLKVRTNSGLDLNNQWYYPTGRTGYEQYYVDMEGFWRQLYCPPQLMNSVYPEGEFNRPAASHVWTERDTHCWYATGAITPDSNTGIYFTNSTGIAYYLTGSYDDIANDKWINAWPSYQGINDGWNVEIFDSPETLNYWFDFLEADEDTDLVKYSVPAIGDRAKSVNDNMVKAIYFRETPTAIFDEDISTVERKSGYTYLQINNIDDYFNMSSQGKSAYDVMEEYINLYLYCIESISITSIPIYHLQPNTKVLVYDEDSKINGEYLVNKITIPLTFNGTMSVSAVKSAERIY